MTRIAMIAAVAENGVIGSEQSIPWRIPSDMALFKRMTLGKPIIMGRKQYETVGKPLPNRTNIVVTRQAGFSPQGVVVVHDMDTALAEAQKAADRDGAEEIMIIGGGEIYHQAMDRADRLYITHVALSPEGDVHFPAIDAKVWEVVEEPSPMPDPRDEAPYRVKVYARRQADSH